MSAALDEAVFNASSVAAAAPTTRVAIREIRDVTFRALVASGASTAEAKVASDQVLYSELHRGSGLVALLEELSSGPWGPAGMTCERDDTGERAVLRVVGPGTPGALHQGALLVDLLAADPDPGAVVISHDLRALSSLLDEPLIRTARCIGSFVVAAHRSASVLDFRVASPDGAIGLGTGGATSRLDADFVSLPLGASLFRREASPEAPITWLTAGEQQATRAAAAQRGRQVDAALWTEVSTAAHAYLVPEQ